MSEHFAPKHLPNVSLVCVPPWLTGDVWLLVGPMIEVAYRRNGRTMPPMVESDLAHGHALLWLALHGDEHRILCATLTRLIRADDGSLVCWISACAGGRMREWLPFHLELERYARAEGCAKVILRGRRGWLRALSGYKQVGDDIEKVL